MGSLLYLPVIWLVATSWLFLLTSVLLPDSQASQNLKDTLKFPSTLDELKSITNSLLEFQQFHPIYVYLLFSSAYIYKQTFAIPGSVFLNLLSGALFGPWIGTCICCIFTALGASLCYLLSLITGTDIIIKFWPDKINQLRSQVQSNANRLPYFLLSLRLVPVTPNWFINITSPILNIPLHIFAITAFLGLIPYNFVCVKAGSVLSQLQSVNDLLNFQTVCNLLLLAIVASLPGFLNRKLQKVS